MVRWIAAAGLMALAALSGMGPRTPRGTIACQRDDGADRIQGDMIVFNDNGGWCWFQDERAIVHDGRLIIGSVANGQGTGGAPRDGSVEVTVYDLEAGTLQRAVLHERLQPDDHNAPAFLALPDGRLLAVYSRHGSDRFMRCRITRRPGDATDWGPEQALDVGAGCTYSNLFRLSAEGGHIYNFHRGRGWDPNVMISDDEGASWRYGGRLLQDPADTEGRQRPYLKYAGNGIDTIHFIATEQHPRNFDNSIYHGFIRGGMICRSDGTPAGELSAGDASTVRPGDLTRVFAGDADRVAWTTDIQLDGDGRPVVAFSVQMHRDDQDHRYYYGRWDGERWRVHEMAHAGARLYHPENDYTGLVALDPGDPDRVYLSTDADPATGAPLISRADQQRHREIFQGVTPDGGASWTWTPITSDSRVDNLRPIVPVWEAGTALLWLRGTYSTYTRYDLQVVGLILHQR